MRFVVIATAVRGAVDPPEPLDKNGQGMAAYQMALDEAAANEVRVWWRTGFDPECARGMRKPVRRVTVEDLVAARQMLAAVNR